MFRSVASSLLLFALGFDVFLQGQSVPAQTVVVNWGGDYVTFDNNLRGYITDEYPVSLDGGANDARSYCAYSDATPLHPPSQYAQGPSYRFFGGVLLLKFNGGPFAARWAEIWSGSSIAPLDKLYYGVDTHIAANDRNTVGYDFRFWKKADFLGGGATTRVAFGPTSALEILNYEGGGGNPSDNWGRVRLVVQEGGQFYISEDYGGPSQTSGSFVLTDPNSRRWAPYNPAPPYAIAFDAQAATFVPHTFNDIAAVGYYHSNDNTTDPNRKAGFTAERFRVSAQLATFPPPAPPTNVRVIR